MIRIVGVHGVGKHRSESVVVAARQTAAEWKAAIAASEYAPWEADGFDVRIAYYAHLLLRSGRPPLELDPELQEMLGEFIESLVPDPKLVKGSWLPREAADVIAGLFGYDRDAAMAFLGAFFPEVADYLRHEGDFTPRTAILSTVGPSLAKADIVIAHSLGSIVAYEALWQYRTELPLLITIGSPLALPIVFPHLTPAPIDGRGAKPPGVRRWINIADHGDIVASPPAGISARFDGVDLDLHDDIDAFDFHDELSYLRSRQVGMALPEWNADPAPA